MKNKIKFLLIIQILFATHFLYAQDDELNKVTFGIGAGYSHLFKNIYQPSLTTDTIHSLVLQKLSKSNFVISSIIIFKLGKLQLDPTTNKLYVTTSETPPKLYQRLSINLAINLVDVNSDNISFNKTIDGGLGLGCFLTSNIQLALFYDINRYRQLKDYFVENFQDKPIPNGSSYFNALDDNNNDLFYTKAVNGISFKAVFSIGNKK